MPHILCGGELCSHDMQTPTKNMRVWVLVLSHLNSEVMKKVSGWQEQSSVLEWVQYMAKTEDNETEKQWGMRCV